MSEIEIIGRAAPPVTGRRAGYPANGSALPPSKKNELTLCEAAAIANRSVEELKRAIRAGELLAVRCGWVRILHGDLNEYLYR